MTNTSPQDSTVDVVPNESVPNEFLPENVAEKSGDDLRMTDARWYTSGEPYRSMRKNNPWLSPPVGGNSVAATRPDGSLTEPFKCPCTMPAEAPRARAQRHAVLRHNSIAQTQLLEAVR